ncbi:uncharacterized protein A1O9_02030 [Exophiala aquamarina CBS 119918]|uniref:Transcription factor domain-containing protein n=1 Tax=Exophiala aquamarina CBS 119918 TaxID=1182545 RepID=A0A072PK36_9EURO|nr:uncharacterized protein A1O9_02030 [Exophiala aquamarina CBS 119918]KEF60469.1 hypothetical protein A1O9_02030 [Exophiala aquamarina CBS 119918]
MASWSYLAREPVDNGCRSFRFKPRKTQTGRRPVPSKSTAQHAPENGAQPFEADGRRSQSQDQEHIGEFESPSELVVEPYLSLEASLADTANDFDAGLETILDSCVAYFSTGNDNDPHDLPSVSGSIARQQQEGEGDNDNDDDYDESVSASTKDIVSTSSLGQSLLLALEPAELLVFYDSELCTLPFTHDFPENPLRCLRSVSAEPKHLLHAMLAFSLEHVSRLSDKLPGPSLTDQITIYKHSAAECYAITSSAASTAAKRHLLDTIFILFALDAFLSASGPWGARLANAYHKIESMGGISLTAASPRARAQLMMFVWWDCSIALVARSNPVFSSFYYDFALEEHNGATYDIFTISGVPKDLFRYCRELTQIASEKRQISKFKYAVFDMSRVLELEKSIREYPGGGLAPQGEDGAEELIECWHDYYNAANAWKYALLLYISRVFKWDPTSQIRLSEFTSLSRLVLDSVRCCRPDSPMRKQLLFPVFVAGSESLDSYSRSFVQEFCDTWCKTIRYSLFPDAYSVLQEIWAQRDLNASDPTVWWGSVIDSKQLDGCGFLFG